jgi:hypothetical protein
MSQDLWVTGTRYLSAAQLHPTQDLKAALILTTQFSTGASATILMSKVI